MSKRKLSLRQLRTIEKQKISTLDLTRNANLFEGLVITSLGTKALVENNNELIICDSKPSIGVLVAGDEVFFKKENDQQGFILGIKPRRTVLGRVNNRGLMKPQAANITQMCIVIAPKPEVSWTLLDSYLVISEYLNLKATIILNKTDIECAKIKENLIQVYKPLNYKILLCNSKDNKSLELLRNELEKNVSVFVGQSGVGKSSLISYFLPDEESIKISEISKLTELGKHTTSNSYYYHLPQGGALIDSPGVREFGLWQMNSRDIAYNFSEFRQFLGNCKFRDCDHIHTPGCAVADAVQHGEIMYNRYKNYVKIVSDYAKD